jgi:hypothetical protein
MEEVVGSIPTRSTKSLQQLSELAILTARFSNPSSNPGFRETAAEVTLIA